MAATRPVLWIALFAVGIYQLRVYIVGERCLSRAKLDGKVIIITGANTGIGRATATDLARRGGRVILACRSLERGNEAAEYIRNESGVGSDQVYVMTLEMASLTSIRSFVEEFKKREHRLDILINNAGVAWPSVAETEDGFDYTFGVNHLGHFLLTCLLVDLLKASAPSRVVTVSSMSHFDMAINFTDVMMPKGYAGYAQSKTANILFTKELANRLKGTGVTTYALHPGVVHTKILRHTRVANFPVIGRILKCLQWIFTKKEMQGAQTTICCAVDEEIGKHTGLFYDECKASEPAAHASDMVAASKLWQLSEELVGL